MDRKLCDITELDRDIAAVGRIGYYLRPGYSEQVLALHAIETDTHAMLVIHENAQFDGNPAK